MFPVATRSVVLQAFPYGDTSKVLRLYTRDHGLRSVMARGALRPRSRFGGVLEPFTEGDASFLLREGRDLHTLSGFELVRSRQALGRSLVAFAGASLLAEVLLRAGTEDPHPEVYDALVGSLDAVAAAGDDAARERGVLAGAWLLVALLGFAPQLDACVVCTRPVGPEEPSRFDALAGGVACTRCRPVGRLLDAATRGEAASMAAGRAPEALARHATHRALLRAYLDAQIAHDRPMRSMELFLASAGEG